MKSGKKEDNKRMLIVCSYCNRVISDEEAWEQNVEVEIGERGGKVSHGICPDCLLEHFPDEYLAIQEQHRVRIKEIFKKGFKDFYGHLVK